MGDQSKPALGTVTACVFDAYGTLLDTSAAARRLKEEIGDGWEAFAALWRTKQIEYTWLRSLMGAYEDFRVVTRDSLDFTMETLGVRDDGLSERLMTLYDRLDAYPEVPDVLKALRAAGKNTAILSNGSPGMLRSAVEAAGIGNLLDDVLSVDTLQVYKPDPRVYALATGRFGVQPEDVAFFSSNAWDAAGAARFGFRVVWVNRAGQKFERLPAKPEAEVKDLSALTSLFNL